MAVEPGGGRPPSGLTLALGAIGATSLELAVCGTSHSTATAFARAGGLVAAMLGAFALLARGRGGRPGSGLTRRETIALVVLAAVPFAWHPARVALLGGGVMLETMLLEALRNLGLGLAALARRPLPARLAAVVALFEVLVGSSLVEGAAMTSLAGAFAVLGAAWLLARYWSGLPGRPADEAGRGIRPSPGGALAALGVVGAILAVAAIGPTTAATTLAGLMPTSGGTDWSDAEARSGVGDGPNEVDARESADSVGFSQSDVYLETDKPSLYDAFSETFGEPFKKNRQEKAIALAATEIQQNREHPAEDYRAGREFATHRKPPARRHPPEAAADALLFVRGRAPAHLRLVAYDRYDGGSWIEGESASGPSALRAEGGGSPWLRLESPARPFLSGKVAHRVKVGRLATGSIPAPAHLDRFRVGSVDRVDFYEWAQAGILRMTGRTIPTGTVIDTESRTVHPDRLRRLAIPEHPPYALIRDCEAAGASPIVAELAREWGAGIPRGWGQVEAIVARLRGHCMHDRSAVPPEGCPDPVAHFLGESRRGPDYLFATAAALMLRSLGYPSRVVGGLYVDPGRYDPIARHVAVGAADAHLWAEVQVPGGDWVTIEPTPGFGLMAPALGPLDRLLAGLAAVGRWTARHAGAVGLAGLCLVLLAWRRREALDRLWTLAWWVGTPAGTPGRAVLDTLRLVERRARYAGRARSPGTTPGRWCGAVAAGAPVEAGGDLRALVVLAGWSAYAPGPLPVDVDCRILCRRVVRTWTLGAFRTLSRDARPTEEPPR